MGYSRSSNGAAATFLRDATTSEIGSASVSTLLTEDHVRQLSRLERPEDRRKSRHAIGHGLHDDDADVGDVERVQRLLQQLDRSGAIDDRPVVSKIVHRCGVEFGAHLARPRLAGRIPDRIALLDGALAVDRARREEHALKKGRLAAEIGPTTAAQRALISFLLRTAGGQPREPRCCLAFILARGRPDARTSVQRSAAQARRIRRQASVRASVEVA